MSQYSKTTREIVFLISNKEENTMNEIVVSESLRKFAELNTPENLFGEPARSGLGGKVNHVKNVIRLGMKLVTPEMNPELASICLQLHDIGRSVQWSSIAAFNDGKMNHRYMGMQMIEQYVRQEKCPMTPDWRIVTDVMQYHGVQHMWGLVSEASMPYVVMVSKADNVENGCCGALGYLEDEKSRDDKGYIKANPERDQRDCKPHLLDYLEKGQKFNKMVECTTYAEYFVFAAMLAVNACLDSETSEIAREAMRDLCYLDEEKGSWLNAVDGYCCIFNRHLHPADAARACEIMRTKCR